MIGLGKGEVLADGFGLGIVLIEGPVNGQVIEQDAVDFGRRLPGHFLQIGVKAIEDKGRGVAAGTGEDANIRQAGYALAPLAPAQLAPVGQIA